MGEESDRRRGKERRRLRGRLDAFERAVRETVARHRMFEGARRVVAAVSGGPDSMAMLHALARIRAADESWPEPVVAHLDHGLRGDASREDAEFVLEAARRLGLEAAVERAEVAAEAARRRRNLEAVARELRYAFLERAASAAGAPVVATGHTATDQAETVLMRLARGAGTDGLAGVAAVRPLGRGGARLVRPLLGVTREEALDYCRERGIAFRLDATNEETERARAYVRRELLPRLGPLSSSAVRNLARAASLAADDRAFFEARVAELFAAWGAAGDGPVELPAAQVAALEPALRRRVLREAVRRAHGDLRRLALDHVESLERLLGPGRGGREAVLPYGVRARRRGKLLVVGRAVENRPPSFVQSATTALQPSWHHRRNNLMNGEKVQVLVTSEEIATRVGELAGEIRAAYEGQDLTIVGLLEDSFVFLSDLIRAINAPLKCCFLKASVHQSGGHMDILYTTEFDPQGANILLVGGILDTGVTIDYIVRQITARGAKSVRSCVLVDKPDFRTTEFTPDFVGFTRSEPMIIGYGLGISNNFRYLPDLAIVAPE